MMKLLKKKSCFVIIVSAVLFLSLCCFGSSSLSGKEVKTASINHGKPEDRPTYMGMLSVNAAFMLPLPVPMPNVQTSHGVFFPKIQLYTGLSAEYYTVFNYLALNPHVRYYFPTQKRTMGYVGVEVGCLMAFYEGETNAGLDLGPEVGFTVNFSKVSLDIGVKAVFFPTEGLENVVLPIRVGLVF